MQDGGGNLNFFSKIRKNNLSITFKLIAIVTIIISLALFALGFIINNSISEKIEKISVDRSFDVTNLLKKEVNNYFKGVEKALVKIAGNYGIRSNNQVELVIKRKFREEIEGYNNFSSMFFIGKDDLLVTIPEKEEISDYYTKNSEWYRKAKEEGELYWTQTHESIVGNKDTFSVVFPVFDYSDKFIGIMGGNISIDKLSDIISWEIGESGYVFMIDKGGSVVAHTDKSLLNKNINMNNYLEINKLLQKEKGSISYNYNGKTNLLSYIKLPIMNGAIMAQVPEKQAFALQNNIQNIIIKTGLVILIFLILSLFFIIDYSLIKPIISLKSKMKKLESGDFDIEIDINRSDEIGVLAEGFRSMLAKIESIINSTENLSEEIDKSADSITSSSQKIMNVSKQVAGSVEDVSSGANVQSENVEEVNKKMKLLDKGIDKLKESNQLLQDMAKKMTEATKSGEEKVSNVKEQMFVIDNTISKAAKDIKELHNISADIDSIVEIINSIAKQTNLLALNASIEAARAGQAGNGFTVVANEIRNLSEESTESANKISELINKIKEETEDARNNMNESKSEIKSGINAVEQTTEAFHNIESSLNNVKEGIEESSLFVKKSTENSKNIINNMENIAGISQQNSALAQEVQGQSEIQLNEVQDIICRTDELSEMIGDLNKLIQEFKNEKD